MVDIILFILAIIIFVISIIVQIILFGGLILMIVDMIYGVICEIKRGETFLSKCKHDYIPIDLSTTHVTHSYFGDRIHHILYKCSKCGKAKRVKYW